MMTIGEGMPQSPDQAKPVFAYRPQLDGLRFVCIIITIFNHVQGAPAWINGSVGVDIFFALSGFLITSLLIEEFKRKGTVSIRAFYIRRVCRIAPLYVLAFLITVFAAFVLAHLGQKDKLAQFSAAWPWILTFNREYCPSGCGTFFGHAWTIGIEEKFYVFWPLIFLFSYRGTRVLLPAMLLLAIVGMFLIFSDDSFKIRGYVGIVFGCLAGLWYFKYKREIGSGFLWSFVIFVSYWLLCSFHWKYGNLLISASSAMLIVSLVNSPESAISRILGNPLAAFLGKLTYGIYLFHVLVINAVEIALKFLKMDILSNWALVAGAGYCLTVCVAYVLYISVEKPVIDIGRRLSKKEEIKLS